MTASTLEDGVSATPRAVVEKWYASLSAMDIESFSTTLHDDFINNVAGRTPVSGRSYGKKQLFESVFPLVMANLVPGTVNLARRYRIMAVDGPIVVGMMEGGADTVDGQRYGQTYCQIFRVEDGTIREIWEFFDTMQAEARLFGNPVNPGEVVDDPLRF